MDTVETPDAPATDPAKPPYHHGDLRAALLLAAEAELAEHGVEGFSLRQVAKRAGVSHAAPAHHFGDANGLLTALAAHAFGAFLAMQLAHEAEAPDNPREKLIASGLGYIAFARARPTLFRLMFGSQRTDYGDPTLRSAADAAFFHLMANVQHAGGDGAADVAAVWSMAHGLADLLVSGRMKMVEAMAGDALRDMLAGIIARTLPRP